MAEVKTYLIKQADGTEMQIEVPADWKVTFGPAAKGDHGASRSGMKMPMALRFYESDTKQRAIFTDVLWFRDMSIPVKVKKTRVQEKDGYTECEGVRKRTTFQATVHEWVDPDAEVEQPRLPSDSQIYDLD